MVRLNLGCGDYKLPGYINCDIRKEVNADLYFDILNSIPLNDESVEEVVATEFLEHFGWRDEIKKVLAEITRVLKRGGSAYFETPNLRKHCEAYLSLPYERGVEFIYGGQRSPYDVHKSGFGAESLKNLLLNYFSDVSVEEKDYSLVAKCKKA